MTCWLMEGNLYFVTTMGFLAYKATQRWPRERRHSIPRVFHHEFIRCAYTHELQFIKADFQTFWKGEDKQHLMLMKIRMRVQKLCTNKEKIREISSEVFYFRALVNTLYEKDNAIKYCRWRMRVNAVTSKEYRKELDVEFI